MKNRKWLQMIIIVVIIAVGGWTIGDALISDDVKPPRAGDQTLDFSVVGLDGEPYKLSSFKGRPVVINFWGTFCEPCVREIPIIEGAYQKYGGVSEGLVILGVNLDEPLVSVRSFVREYAMTYPILLDKATVRRQYGVVNYPSTFFVNGDGVVVRFIEGEMTEAQFHSALAAIGVSL